MIKWQVSAFNALSHQQLYDALQLRERVFTIIQKCSEPDMDGQDVEALHVLGYEGNTLVAYSRIYKKHHSMYIGRVVVNPDHQGKGLGRDMMVYIMQYLTTHFPGTKIEMSAQSYLEKFYQSFGFKSEGEIYEEAGIPHRHMSYDA